MNTKWIVSCLVLVFQISTAQTPDLYIIQKSGDKGAGDLPLYQMGPASILDSGDVVLRADYAQSLNLVKTVMQKNTIDGQILDMSAVGANQPSSCNPGAPTNSLCYDIVSNYAASKNGQYFYYINLYNQTTGSTTLVRYTINNGELRSEILYDFYANGYSEARVAVNNDGMAAVFLQGSNGQNEIATVSRLGVKTTLMTTPKRLARSGSAIAINNLGTVFVALDQGSSFGPAEIYSIRPNTAPKLIDLVEPAPLQSYTNFSVPDVVPPLTHPEGILYYQKNNKQIVRSDGQIVLNLLNTNMSLFDFNVNRQGEVIWTGQDAIGFFVMKNQIVLLRAGAVLLDSVEAPTFNITVQQMSYPSINDSGNISVIASEALASGARKYALISDISRRKLCKVSDKGKEVGFYTQVDTQWRSDLVGNVSGKTMINKGCAVASLAMLFNFYDLKSLDGSTITPKNLNTNLYTHKNGIGFIKNAPLVSWVGAAETMRDAYVNQCISSKPQNVCREESKSVVSYKEEKSLKSWTAADEKKVEDEICKGNPVILALQKGNTTDTHFVLATGFDKDVNGQKTFIFHDPGINSGADQIYSGDVKLKYPKVLGFRRYVKAKDPAMVFAASTVNTSFVITDPLGRRAGFDSINSIMYDEIPDAQYYKESISTPNEPEFTDQTVIEANRFSHMLDVRDGVYEVKLYGLSDGPYVLEIKNVDRDGFSNGSQIFEGAIKKGEVKIFSFKQTEEPSPVVNSELSIHHALYLDPKSIKKTDKDRVVLSGTLGLSLAVDGDVSIQIGGDSGITKVIPKIQIQSRKVGKIVYYESLKTPMKIVYNSNGDFFISLKELNLDQVPQDKWGQITLQIGSKIGHTEIKLKCQMGICLLKKE